MRLQICSERGKIRYVSGKVKFFQGPCSSQQLHRKANPYPQRTLFGIRGIKGILSSLFSLGICQKMRSAISENGTAWCLVHWTACVTSHGSSAGLGHGRFHLEILSHKHIRNSFGPCQRTSLRVNTTGGHCASHHSLLGHRQLKHKPGCHLLAVKE